MSSPLTWTRERPLISGWYWIRSDAVHGTRETRTLIAALIALPGDELQVANSGELLVGHPLHRCWTLFAGPIPFPSGLEKCQTDLDKGEKDTSRDRRDL
jgi:hypothetical protein